MSVISLRCVRADISNPRGRRREVSQVDYQKQRNQNVNDGHYGIANCSVWSFHRRGFAPHYENCSDHQCIKNEVSRNHVIEQLTVHISILELLCYGIRCYCPRQCQQTRPNALSDQRNNRNVTGAEIAGAFEENTIARHRVVDASARENQSVIAAEGRDHNRDRH